MNANNFIQELSLLTSSLNELNGYSEKFINNLLDSYNLKPLKIVQDTDMPIIDLISSCDVSKVDISMIRFNEKIEHTKSFLIFGRLDAFPLAINEVSGEIVELDWDNLNFVVSYCSKDQTSFLDCLIEVEKVNLLKFKNAISEIDLKEEISRIAKLSGGNKYLNFYQQILE